MSTVRVIQFTALHELEVHCSSNPEFAFLNVPQKCVKNNEKI